MANTAERDTFQRERERAYAWSQLGRVLAAPDRAFSVHYATQRLQRNRNPVASATAPVAAIALRHIATGRSKVFSIKAEADAARIDLSASPPASRLAELEYALLYKFNDFLSRYPGYNYMHWYMRDERFGFLALEERHRQALGSMLEALYGPKTGALGQAHGLTATPSPFPVHIPEANRIDLALILRQLYGMGPVRLRDLAAANRLSHAEMIEGVIEPEMFERGNHAVLEWSTASKARLIAELAVLAHTGEIKAPARLQTEAARTGRSPGLRLFINYRREDTEAAANWLHALLSERLGQDNVFIDTDDIPVGLDFIEVLRRQIDNCDAFLVMIGRGWAKAKDDRGNPRLGNPDDFVRSEIRAALAREIPVIPVLVEGAPMPAAEDLPADILPLRRRHAAELRFRDFRKDVDTLVAKLREATRLSPSHRQAF